METTILLSAAEKRLWKPYKHLIIKCGKLYIFWETINTDACIKLPKYFTCMH